MNGLVIIDKPAGKTSHDVVMDVKKAVGAQKAGHTGTLDPMATGVLPVCINEGTKLSRFLVHDEKEYLAEMLLGMRTDTYDKEGAILTRNDPCLDIDAINMVLCRFRGKIEQAAPPFSAVKYRGLPMYKWARKGINVPVQTRIVEIRELAIKEVKLPYVTLKVRCSKGTYIRSLCADIGDALGCGACLTALRRTRSGPYSEDSALVMTEEAVRDRKKAIESRLIPLADILSNMPFANIDQSLADKICQGVQPQVAHLLCHDIPFLAAGDMLRFIHDERLVAIAEMLYSSASLPSLEEMKPAVRILRVFNEN